MNYYFLHFQHDNAYLRGEKGCPEVFAGAPVDLAEWKVPILSITDGSALLDLHGSSLGARVVSLRLKQLIVKESPSDAERIQFLPVRVKHNGQVTEAFALHFAKTAGIEVLDSGKTDFTDGDNWIRPCVDASIAETKGLRIFVVEPSLVRIFVSDPLRKAMLAAGMEGLDFSGVASSS